MSVNAQANTPIPTCATLDELTDNVNRAFMQLYQQLSPVLVSLQGGMKNVTTLDSSTYPNAVAFSVFMTSAPAANGFVVITFSDGTTAKLLAHQ
jgi:hypothetical protein